MKKHLPLFQIFLLWASILAAQTQFTLQIGGTSSEGAYDLNTDADGNILLTGLFYGTCDFDPGPGVQNRTVAGAQFDYDAFVAKYSPTGQFLWVSTFASGGTALGRSIAADENGNVYACGWFKDSLDLDPGAGVQMVFPNGSEDLFFVKLDPANGNLVWGHGIGSAGDDKALTVRTNKNGHVYLHGRFLGTADFDPSAGVANLSSSAPPPTNYLNTNFFAKYDYDGGFVWAKQIGGTAQAMEIWKNASNQDFITLTGDYASLAEDFDPGAGTVNGLAGGGLGADIFLARYDASGNFLWAKFHPNANQGQGWNGDTGEDVVTDAAGNVYMLGSFIGDLSQTANSGLTLNNYGTIGQDACLVKYDGANGNVIWQKQMGVTNQIDGAERLGLDPAGNIIANGLYWGGSIEVNSAGASFTHPNAGQNDMFVVSFSPDGQYLWSGKVGGTGQENGTGMAVHGNTVVLSGIFQNTADCDPTDGVSNLTSFGSYDIWVTAVAMPAPLDNPPGAQPIAAAAFSSGNVGYFDDNFGSAAAALFPCNGSVSRDVWFKFTATVSNPTLNFSNLNCTAPTTGIEVVVLSGSNLNNFQPIGTCTSPGSTGNFSMPLSNLTVGQTYFVAVDANGAAGCTWQISVGGGTPPPPPVCGVPQNLREKDLTATSVKLTWKNMGATEYQIQFKQNGLAWVTTTTTDTFLVKNNLLAHKTHSWRIRAKCGTTWTAYSPTRTFTTPKTGTTCTSPTDVWFSNLTTNSVLVDWLPAVGATSYNLKYRKTGTTAWTSLTTAADQLQISNLLPNSIYQVQIRTRCAATWFPFSPVYTFSTPVSVAPADDRAAFSENSDSNLSEKSAQNFDLKIYPNPAREFFNLHIFSKNEDSENAKIEIFDAAGRRVFEDFWQIERGENGFQILISDFPKGIFWVKIRVGEKLETRQLVVF